MDNSIRLFDLSSGSLLTSCYGHTNKSLKSSHALLEPEGKYIISGSEDNYIYAWNIEELDKYTEEEDNFIVKSDHLGYPTLQIAKHPKNSTFAGGSMNGIIRIIKFL